MNIPQNELERIIRTSLDEDIATGDITTDAIFTKPSASTGVFLLKSSGVVGGFEVVSKVFEMMDKETKFTPAVVEGEYIEKGMILGMVQGNTKTILKGERTALNLLQRISGIATYAHEFAKRVSHTKAKVIDTRKTAPGLRALDKYAVELGGCSNHRFGLYDMFLIKDNHIAAAGSITDAIRKCKHYGKLFPKPIPIEVEVKNFDEVQEALKEGVDRIMLDNFSVSDMMAAVSAIAGACEVEASGGVKLDNVAEIAETGVDYISVGALTHSVRALDISLIVNN